MNDETPIFTDDEESVNQEIAKNEKRASESRTSPLEHAIDRVVAPIARALQDQDLTPEEAEEAARQNDREQNR